MRINLILLNLIKSNICFVTSMYFLASVFGRVLAKFIYQIFTSHNHNLRYSISIHFLRRAKRLDWLLLGLLIYIHIKWNEIIVSVRNIDLIQKLFTLCWMIEIINFDDSLCINNGARRVNQTGLKSKRRRKKNIVPMRFTLHWKDVDTHFTNKSTNMNGVCVWKLIYLKCLTGCIRLLLEELYTFVLPMF